MLLPIIDQFRIVLCGLLAGIIVGVLYDVYRIARGNNVTKVILVIEDTLFWILCAVVVFIFLLYTNYAVIGMYIYTLIFIGFIIYLKLFSRFITSVEKRILNVIGIFFRTVINHLSYYFRLIFFKNKSYKK